MTDTSENSGLIAAAMQMTSPEMSLSMDVANTYRDWIKQRGARVALYRQYERGDHRASITAQMRKMLRLNLDSSGMVDFCDNYCSIVIDKMTGRLRVTEVAVARKDSVPADAENLWLNAVLEKNNWDALQGTVFRGATLDGDSFVMVDPETLQWTSEPAYDGYSGVFALFDNNMSTPYWACKIWSEASHTGQDEVMRVVVYEPERISYWRGKEGGTELIPDVFVPLGGKSNKAEATTIRAWPVSTPPIVHFGNKIDNYSDNGESEIRPAIPLQDVLNRTLHSMVSASEFAAFNILWSKGIALDVDGIVPGAVLNLLIKDANGNVVTEPSPELTAFLSAVQVGQFTGTDIGQYTNQIDKIVREISQVTSTPIYGITNQGAVSGEALKQLEIGLIGKCERFQRQNTDAVRQLVKLTAEIQSEFDGDYAGLPPPPPEIDGVKVAWKSPEILDVTAQVVALFQMRRDAPGLWPDSFYQARIGGLLGMSQASIKEESDKALSEQSNRLASLVGAGGNIPPV